MKYLYLLSVVVTVVLARPEPPSGYPRVSGPAQQQPILAYLAPAQGSAQPNFGGSSFHSAGPSHHGGGGFHSGGGGGGGHHQHHQGPAQVEITKNIYVHVAPEEPIEQLSSPALPPQIARKHYKIIFIKAPSQQQQQQLAAAPPPQHEEKTIVYVLVKKPEQLQLDSPPAEPPRPPSKPEVYFIKYRAQEAQGGPSGGSNFHSAPQPSAQYGPPAAGGGGAPAAGQLVQLIPAGSEPSQYKKK